MRDDLNLPEELLLLILDDDSGRERASLVSYLCAGAALAEFALEGRIEAVGEGRKQRFDLVDASQPRHPYLATVLELMQAKGFSKKPRDLVAVAGRKTKTLNVLRSALVDRHVLRREERKLLGLFPYTVYPLADRAAEEAIKARLRVVIASEGAVDPRDAVLITLAKQSRILDRNFGKEFTRERKARIKAISEGESLAATATRQAIEAVQAAMIAASTAAVSAGVVSS